MGPQTDDQFLHVEDRILATLVPTGSSIGEEPRT